ncbi:hypothetical protein OE88DRAFT_1655215 [Heliocybe sulcata]|uniref:MYND-type domain-containing protein n=1 Tax=Heliocybe sulcata TaxID=5364 RepID=A0A5C3NLL2_9AGAM|nr:hypothetical protein OE88DRAFT_1655215 [Heliocybe sulcata]
MSPTPSVSLRSAVTDEDDSAEYSGEKSIYDRCWYCQKVAGRKNVKRCSNCLMVWYCSKECQKSAWPTHKPRCKTGSHLWDQLANEQDGEEKAALHRDLTKWVATWREVICRYALDALDLANHGASRINTHTIFIELTSRKRRGSKTREIEMVDAAIWDETEFEEWINDVDISEEDLERVGPNRGRDTVQICMTCDGPAGQALRFLWFQLKDNGALYMNIDKKFSAMMAEMWSELLEVTLDSGNPKLDPSEAFMLLDPEYVVGMGEAIKDIPVPRVET